MVDGPETCEQPTWHPDGSALAYTEAGMLWVYDLEAGGRHALNPDGLSVADEFAVTPVRWSADGTALATKIQDQDDVLGLAAFTPGDTGPTW